MPLLAFLSSLVSSSESSEDESSDEVLEEESDLVEDFLLTFFFFGGGTAAGEVSLFVLLAVDCWLFSALPASFLIVIAMVSLCVEALVLGRGTGLGGDLFARFNGTGSCLDGDLLDGLGDLLFWSLRRESGLAVL